MTEEKALELLDLEPGATASEIRRAYQEIYNELQIRLTNAPTEHQKELYRKRLAAVEEAYLFLGGESEEDLSELPSTGPVEHVPEEKAQASKFQPMTEAAALELLGLSRPFSRGKLEDAYKSKKGDFEKGLKSAPNKAIKDSFQQLIHELEEAFRLLEPLAESPAPVPPKPKAPKPQPEKKKSSPFLWAIPAILLLAISIWFFWPKGEKHDKISQELRDEFIKVKSQADLLAEQQDWDQALEKYQEAYGLLADTVVNDSIKSIEQRLAAIAKDTEAKEKAESEAKDWATAQRANSTAGYLDFIKKYPSGTYTAQAEQKIRDLEAELRNQSPASTSTNRSTQTIKSFTSILSSFDSASTSTNRSTQTTSPASTATSTPSRQTTGSLPQAIQELERNMVYVQGGTFTMGCTGEQRDCDKNEKPAHAVTLSSFSIGKYEVMQAQWRSVMGSDPPELYNKGCDQCPVENVSWDDIQGFLRKLNQVTGKTYRLPTEAEWEYAARGGNKSKGYLYSGSDNLSSVAWFTDNAQSGNTHGSQKTTRPVGQKSPNELGLYDMSGNVWEWCSDWYGANYYSNSPGSNPRGPESGSDRVLRGGGWFNGATYCRVANRLSGTPAGYGHFGFRVVLSQ